MKFTTIITFFLSIFILFGSADLLLAQENTPMRVVHGTAVSQNIRIKNIFVGADNKKYVAGDGQVFELFSADNATPLLSAKDHWHLLLQTDGNALRRFPLEKIQSIIGVDTEGNITTVNSVFFDDTKKTLWIGTHGKGLFQLSVSDDQATLTKQYTSENSKLKSNNINALLVDKYQRVWAGSDEGVLMRESGDSEFKLFEKREKILDITALGPDIWILGMGILWMADERNRWIPGDVDSRLYRGRVRDIQYDSEGRLWVASEIITRYDVERNTVERFDRSNGFTSENVSVIRVDQEDALWVGTLDQGIFLIEPAAKMTVSAEVTSPLGCDGKKTAAVRAKVIGGNAPYSYKWNKNVSGAHPKNLGKGLYEVTITDAVGQTRKASANVIPPSIKATASLDSPAARADTRDGRATATASGGQPPYRFEWDNGEKTATATQLSPGLHTVNIMDAQNCRSIVVIDIKTAPPLEVAVEDTITAPVIAATTTVTEIEKVAETSLIQAPAPKPVPLTPLDVKISYQATLNCPGATTKVTTTTTGGAAPYNYSWSTPESPNRSEMELPAGNYKLTVTDAKGNTNEQQFSINAPAPLMASANVIEAASDDSARNGRANVEVKGGTGKYLILWDNGEEGAKAEKLKFGKHSVSISDANGCKTVATLQVKKKIIAALDASRMQQGQTIQIEQLFFSADSTQMKSTSLPVLEELYNFLSSNPTIAVEIGGHTNNVPSHEYCDALSAARAKSVVDYLTKKGISDAQLTYKGYGKRKPLVSNRSSAGRKKNQRVEIKVLKLE